MLSFWKLTKNQQKIDKKRIRIWNGKKKASKLLYKWIWDGLGHHLGRVWDGLGPLLGAFCRHLAVFWPFKIKTFLSIGPRWAPIRLLDRFWLDLERIWWGFGKVFGRFGEEVGKILGLLKKFWSDFGNAWHDLALLGHILYKMDPRVDPRSVSMRGGPPPGVRDPGQESSSLNFPA